MKEQEGDKKGSNVLEEVVYIPTNYGGKKQEFTPERKNHKDTAFLYFSAVTALIVSFTFGCNAVWTSPVLPKLEVNDTNVNPLGEPITTSQTSLLVGIPMVLSLFTTLFMGKIPDIIGRRETLKYLSIGMILSNIALAFGSNIYVYYVAKSTFMIFGGSAIVVIQIYISEISEDHNRTKFGCLMGVTLPSGNLYSFVLGPITSVRNFTLLCILPLVFPIIFFNTLVPESPVYLASKGEKEETIMALRKLRNNKSTEEIEQDYLNIVDSLNSKMKSEKRGFLNLFETRALRKGIMIALVANLTQFLSGVGVIMPFLGPLITEAGTELSGNTVAIIVGALKISIFFVTSFIVERLGRRPLLLFSSMSTGIPLFCLGLYFYWKNTNVEFIADIRILPVISILTYVVCYSLGLGPIPMAIVGELFPGDMKSVATTFIMVVSMASIAVMNFIYPIAAKYLGNEWCIWTFAFFSFFGFIIMYFKLPETKGKSFREIQEILSK